LTKTAEYQREIYKKWYKKDIGYIVQKHKKTRQTYDGEFQKWNMVFQHVYMEWEIGCKRLYQEGFFEGMQLKDFKVLWIDKIHIINRIYDLLRNFNDNGIEKIV